MRVLFDHDVFVGQKTGGVSRYFSELARRMPAYGVEVVVFAGIHNNTHLRGLNGIIGARVPTLRGISRLRQKSASVAQRLYLSLARIDIVHKTFYDPAPVGRARKLVVTIYDMIPELFPEHFDQTASERKRSLCRDADLVICISDNTRRDALRLYGLPEAKVRTIPLGTSLAQFCGTDPLRRTRPFLLWVGGRHGYKNFAGFLKAFAGTERARRVFDVVCFGGGSFQASERRELEFLGLERQFFNMFGDDALLAACYRGARVLVYLSLYEGFGLPILEAMATGCPVITSSVSSLPEVGGSAAIYVDPRDVDAIRTVLERSLFHDDLLSQKRLEGVTRAKKFSWDLTAQRTAAAYAEL